MNGFVFVEAKNVALSFFFRDRITHRQHFAVFFFCSSHNGSASLFNLNENRCKMHFIRMTETINAKQTPKGSFDLAVRHGHHFDFK